MSAGEPEQQQSRVSPAEARRCEVATKQGQDVGVGFGAIAIDGIPSIVPAKPGMTREHPAAPTLVRGATHERLCEINPGGPALNAASGRLALDQSRSRAGQQSCHISVNGIRQRHGCDEGDVLFPRLNERDVLLKQACGLCEVRLRQPHFHPGRF